MSVWIRPQAGSKLRRSAYAATLLLSTGEVGCSISLGLADLMADVFISYKREDYKKAAALSEFLASEGYSSW